MNENDAVNFWEKYFCGWAVVDGSADGL